MDSVPASVVPSGRASTLGDRELLALMARISAAERTLTAHALAYLTDIQRRKLYAEAGYPSMFAYCVGELRYSEATAYRRLQSADALNRFPGILPLLKRGDLTVCALSIIAKHLTPENSGRLLDQAAGKSARDVLRLAATLAPRPDTSDSMRLAPAAKREAHSVETQDRHLAPSPGPSTEPAPKPALSMEPEPSVGQTPRRTDSPGEPFHPAPNTPQPRPQTMTPRSPERVFFSFTGSEELRLVVKRLQELLWHKYPAGRLEDILLETGKAYLESREPGRLPQRKPRPRRVKNARTVARWVKSAVYRRDGGACTYKSHEGRRCGARRGLEYDHVKPWSLGGRSDDPKNIRLLCREHNQLVARKAGLA